MANFYERLGDLLAEKEMTVKELAAATDMNAHSLYMYLNLDTYGGRRVSHPRVDTLVRLADALDVSLDYLWGRSDKR